MASRLITTANVQRFSLLVYFNPRKTGRDVRILYRISGILGIIRLAFRVTSTVDRHTLKTLILKSEFQIILRPGWHQEAAVAAAASSEMEKWALVDRKKRHDCCLTVLG